jgi:hypothetical protein
MCIDGADVDADGFGLQKHRVNDPWVRLGSSTLLAADSDFDPGVFGPSTPRRLNEESEMAAPEKRRTRPSGRYLPF